MATYPGNGRSRVITLASDTITLGDAGQQHAVSRWVVSWAVSGTGSIKPQKAITIVDSVGTTQPSFADCWYTDELANSVVTAGTTQSSGSGIMSVIADGCDVKLVFTTDGAGGTVTVICNPMLG